MALFGQLYSTPYSVWLARLDSDANLIWLKTNTALYGEDHLFRGLVVDPQDYCYLLMSDGYSGVTKIRRIDPDGVTLWETLYEGSLTYPPVGERLMLDNDDRLLVLGTKLTSNHYLANWPTVAKFDTDGTMLEQHVIDMSGGIGMTDYTLGQSIQVVQLDDGNLLWSGTYGTSNFSEHPFQFGGYVMKSTPDYEMEWIFVTPNGSGYFFGYQTRGIESASQIVDDRGRIFLPMAAFGGAWTHGLAAVNVNMTLTPNGELYAINAFQPPFVYMSEIVGSVPGTESFYAVGDAMLANLMGVDLLMVGHYKNPCGTTRCPWLGSCVDVGDAQPGNACWTCEDVNGLAQFVGSPNGSDCGSDGLYCNGDEICQSGWCVHTGNPCEPLMCVESSDACRPGPPDPIPVHPPGVKSDSEDAVQDRGDPLFTPWMEYVQSTVDAGREGGLEGVLSDEAPAWAFPPDDDLQETGDQVPPDQADDDSATGCGR